ncbi:hypothetical protein BZZ08_05804 [Streptomyces sp. MH60]|nr:hypothetical protein BZZ08_05804 [Streptomyces sp. MH60]
MQQPYLGRVGVLVLVDVHRVVLGGQLRGDLGAAGEEHRAVDQFGVVEHALEVEHVEVLGEEEGGGTPVGAADAPGEGPERVRAESQFAAAGEHRADLVGEAPCGQAGPQLVGPAHMGEPQPFQVHLAGEQLAHRHVLLRAGQQPQGFHEQVAVLVGADQGVTEGVKGGRPGGARGADAQRHPLPQLDGRLAAEREHQDALGVAALGDPVRHRLDQRGGLSGARPRQDEQRSGPVVNHGALCGVQTRGVHACRRGTHQSVSATAPPSHLGV